MKRGTAVNYLTFLGMISLSIRNRDPMYIFLITSLALTISAVFFENEKISEKLLNIGAIASLMFMVEMGYCWYKNPQKFLERTRRNEYYGRW